MMINELYITQIANLGNGELDAMFRDYEVHSFNKNHMYVVVLNEQIMTTFNDMNSIIKYLKTVKNL